MSMEPQQIDALGQELYRALRENRTIAPLTERFATITLEDAYAIQTRMNEHRYQDGETVVGKKIGVTSKAVQNRLGVAQPDFGILTSAMVKADGEMVNLDELIQPLAEGEIAFILKRDLMGPGVTNADVLRATEAVMPCFEELLTHASTTGQSKSRIPLPIMLLVGFSFWVATGFRRATLIWALVVWCFTTMGSLWVLALVQRPWIRLSMPSSGLPTCLVL